MNAPLHDALRQALERVTLDDKYTVAQGQVFMSGVQALVRLPMLQRERDAQQGLNTAGFISGYRGSPLGSYDQALWAAQSHLAAQQIVFQPGVNEELGATAVWGTQQLDLYPQAKRFDGVFGMWYGKGPGVDRCSDVFKHANMAGTARHGGVIALAGDDHISKSSTAAHQSDHIFKACGSPVFFPSSVQEMLDMGLHAFAMSRFSGLWAGMKTIQEVVESSSSVWVDPDRVQIALPQDFVMPEGGLHIRWPDAPLAQEQRLIHHKWYAALAYVRANRLNYNVVQGSSDCFGIMASGKAYNDMRQALADLGLDDATCQRIGIRVHKVNVVWPLEASITREFARGLQEILVVEEKRQIIEYQVKEELYNWRDDVRPTVVGKFEDSERDEWGRPFHSGSDWLLRANADLTPALIARAIVRRLRKLGVPDDVQARMDQHVALLDACEQQALHVQTAEAAASERAPWFCSGCPHNTSTRVPEGSRAVAGIGCHYMTVWMDRSTSTFTQMGGEGVTWVGQSPFTKENHVFANLGDGTYFHSGLLAIRQSIAAGVNITYKILYNDAVAMTGGQRVGERPEGHSVLQIMQSLTAEGVRKLVIVTDEPSKYQGVALAPGVTVHHRDELDSIQRAFREIAGCTAIIYDQTCATEKRRRRKRGTLPAAPQKVVINELVCEGCGDCSVQSNCLSVEPVETVFGRKRRINQSSCNQDLSCLKGFCPSLVTVQGGRLKKPQPSQPGAASTPWGTLPEPNLPDATQAWGIVVAGVGGTGVITIGSLLGMAAHLEGKGVITQDAAGLAQKGGATWSHIQIAQSAQAIYTTKVDVGKADLVLGCDTLVAAHATTLATMQAGRTYVALNTHVTPTAALVHNPDWQAPQAQCEARIAQAAGGQAQLGLLDADTMAVQLLGDSMYANALMLGFAWQKGRIPLRREALLRAIELNGVQVASNQAAFEWGRRYAHDPAAVQAELYPAKTVQWFKPPRVAELVAQHVTFLTAYQNAAYAAQYQALVEQVQEAEQRLGHRSQLTEAVARSLFKLMAYKDEYEVARLHTDPAFTQQIADMFEGDYQLVYHLAPPATAAQDAQGHGVKKAYSSHLRHLFRLLVALRGLRGTRWDVFGRHPERQTERALIAQYRTCVLQLLADLTADNHALAVQIARIPQDIRGYGHVKERHLQAAQQQWQTLMQAWTQGHARSTGGSAGGGMP